MDQNSSRKDTRASRLFIGCVSIIGIFVFCHALYQVVSLPFSKDWLLLSLVTIAVASRTDIKIPRISSTITITDTFIYISVLLYGVPYSIILAGVDAAICSLHYPNKRKVMPFNVGVTSLSVFLSSTLVTLAFGNLATAKNDLSRLALAALSLSLLHYILNSGMVSVVNALRGKSNLLSAWRDSFLWASVSYFAGGVAACLVIKLITILSFYAFVIAVPILALTYLTYRNYLDKVQSSITHAEDMADLHLRTIEALAIAIDAKDEVTHDHVHRVQIYATGLGRLFGLSEAEIEALKAGALLHDIGKLAVPDYILNKPGKLTQAEFDRMKVHTIVGSEILERVGFPYPVVPVVRHHHERWDGHGYPDGLRGDQIPITARILSVVDCFDAVCEDRQYRKAMTRDEAVELLTANKGTMYDPQIVDTFLEHLPVFESLIRQQKLDMQMEASEPEEQSLPVAPEKKRDTGKLAFESIRSAHREVITLYDIAQTIGTSLDLRDTFAVFSSRLHDIVSYTTCVLYLQKPNSSELEAAHISGRNTEAFKGRTINLGAGITGWVVANCRPMYNSDPRLDFDALKVQLDEQYRTVAAVPLVKDNQMFGALTLYSKELAAYEADHLRLIEAVAKLASDAISNALHHERTEAKALTDLLTGLPNARALRHRFEEEAALAERHSNSFAVLMMDLDGFKAINDTMGHKAGDEALREMAQILSRHIRSSDFLCRYAGDEFVAIVQANATEVVELVGRLQRSIDQHSFGDGSSIVYLGISVGWASFGSDGDTLDELLLTADRTMYANKLKRKATMPETEGKRVATGHYRLM
jgi:diguanylate cyclase (GGDEF)-like protein/putative nucleotidyltransferase with HDIG domain